MFEQIWINISEIESLINVIINVIKVIIAISSVAGVLKIKLKFFQYKYLNIPLDRITKLSRKYYISTRAQYTDPCDDENVASSGSESFKLIPYFFNHVFKDYETQYFIVLADSGMGKTTFLLNLFFQYYKKIFKRYHIVFLSLTFDTAIEKIKAIKDKEKTILLLDGFDEDKYAMKDYVSRLQVICDETELFYKVIITSRTQFFPNSLSEPKHTNKIRFGIGKKKVEFTKFYISPFNDIEINAYLRKKYNSLFEKKKIKKSKKLISTCPNLMIRPMLLAYIDDIIEDNTKKYRYTFEIYDALVSKWIEREPIEDISLYKFSEKVAEYMYNNKTMYINEDKIEDLCKESNIQIKIIEAKSKSLLNRNANGTYKFAHKSILEYFIAKKAYNDFRFRRTITFDSFKIYSMAKMFLNEMDCQRLRKFRRENNFELKGASFSFSQLSGIFLFSETIVDCDFRASNLTDAYCNDSKFKSVNLGYATLIDTELNNTVLEGINLSFADLTRASLKRANLCRANLMGARLVDANLKDAILIDANLEDAELKDANLKGADLSRANLMGARLVDVNLEDAELEDANLENSCWKAEDIVRAYLQLKVSIFTQINMFASDNNLITIRRSDLFPFESIL